MQIKKKTMVKRVIKASGAANNNTSSTQRWNDHLIRWVGWGILALIVGGLVFYLTF